MFINSTTDMTLTEDLVLVQTILTRYVLVVCFILGIIGSICNLLFFCQKKLRSNSCSIYFIATSIFNLVVILIGMSPVLLVSFFPDEPIFKTSAFCKTRAYTIHVFLMMSRSSVVLACIDRFALCSSHAHVRRLNNQRLAILLVIFITLFWLIIPVHVAIFNDIQMPGSRCGASGIYSIFYSIYAATVTAIPLVMMTIFSFCALNNLRNVRMQIRPGLSNTNGSTRIRKRDSQLITILISEVVIYVVSTVWFPINSIYSTITSSVQKNADRTAIEGFIRYLALSFLLFFNSCALFYVHLLASKAFRRDCKQFIFYLWKKRQHPQAQRSSGESATNRNRNNNTQTQI